MVAIFARGDAAMTVASSSISANFLEISPNLQIDMFVPPTDNEKNRVLPIAFSANIVVNAATKQPEWAKRVVDFFARPKQNALFAKVTNSMTMFDSAHGNITPVMQGLKPWLTTGKTIAWNPSISWRKPGVYPQVLVPQLVGLITGQRSIDDILKSLDDAW
jgi:raffinose/stachyose/melibiose transport system substrate-binding protein